MYPLAVGAPILASSMFGAPVAVDGASERLVDLGVVRADGSWRISAVRTRLGDAAFTGWEADRLGEARIFYGTYLGTMAIAAVIVLIPSVPLVPVLYLSQALNAILLVPLLVVLNRLSGDRELMGEHASTPVVRVLSSKATVVLMACVLALAVVSLT